MKKDEIVLMVLIGSICIMGLLITNLSVKVNTNTQLFIEKNARIMKSLEQNDRTNGYIISFIRDRRDYLSRKEETDLLPKMTTEQFRIWAKLKHAEISQK